MHHYLSKPLNEWIGLGPERGAGGLTLAGHEVTLFPQGVARACHGDTEFPWLIVVPFNESLGRWRSPLVMSADTGTALDRMTFMAPKLQLNTLEGLWITGTLLNLPEESHAANNKQFARMLNLLADTSTLESDFMPTFATILGFRAMVNSYHNYFRQPFLPLADGESRLLATSLLLADRNSSNASRIVDQYRGMYHLGSSDSLELIGTPR